jgi:two-component system sensor histidine kinase KdpD
VGFAYLLLVLVIASTWGFIEALITCLAATVAFNYFFLPPVGTLTIAEPGNWVALFSFLATAVIASRLSAEVKRRAVDAIERRQDVERLYTFSRSILLIEGGEPFAKQLAQKLADTFPVNAALLYDRRTGEIHRAGPADFEGVDDQVREVAQHGSSFFDAERKRVITAVRLGSEPIAALALQGARMPDSVVQGIANLVAIGLERARAQELTNEIEAARRSEHLRTTLIDTMVHEFKTPLTSIKAVTTSLLASPDQPEKSRVELLAIADQEADHLKELIDDAVEMARLDHAQIDLQLEPADIGEIVSSVVESMKTKIEDRPLEVIRSSQKRVLPVDRRLVQLAIKQLLDNVLKYSPARAPVQIRLADRDGAAVVEITDHGGGIPEAEQSRVFQRFYRSPSVNQQRPGSGLGLSIADRIVQAHSGTLGVTSRPGETTFRMTLPFQEPGDGA